MIKIKISVLVFIWSALLFFLNLQYNLLDEFDIAIFWASILLMFGTITYQIFYLKNYKFILFEIFIVYFFLHLVYQVGYYGLRGSDSYVDYNFLKTILNDNSFIFGKDDMSGWPLLHIFSSITSTITKINPLIIAKFLPSFITSIIVIPIYLLVCNIYNKKVALFSCLLFGTIPQFVHFDGLFIRETFAIFFLVLFFYILYVSKKRKDSWFNLLSIILIPVVAFSHHFTSFMLIIFLTIYIVVSKAIPFLYRKDVNIEFSRIKIKKIFLVILVVVISYWIYLAVFILEDFFTIFYEVTGAKDLASYVEETSLGTTIVTLKGNIIYYGFFFFQGVLSLILLIKLLMEKNKEKIEDAAFTMFLYFSLFYGFLGFFFLGSILIPDRFLPFGWMFGVIPLAGCIFHLKKGKYKKILVILLAAFIVYNLYNINDDYITGNPQLGGVVAGDREYSIAKTIPFPPIYYGYIGVVGAIYDIQGIQQRTGGKALASMDDFYNSSSIAIINEEPYLKNMKIKQEKSKEYDFRDIEILSYKNDKDINKICDLGSIYVLKGGGIQ